MKKPPAPPAWSHPAKPGAIILWVFQLVDSDEPLNPYGVKRMAKHGEGRPMVSIIDGPCCLVRFEGSEQ